VDPGQTSAWCRAQDGEGHALAGAGEGLAQVAQEVRVVGVGREAALEVPQARVHGSTMPRSLAPRSRLLASTIGACTVAVVRKTKASRGSKEGREKGMEGVLAAAPW
jgi:hypothetical protein